MRKFILVFSLTCLMVIMNACIIAVVEYPDLDKSPKLDEFYRILPM